MHAAPQNTMAGFQRVARVVSRIPAESFHGASEMNPERDVRAAASSRAGRSMPHAGRICISRGSRDPTHKMHGPQIPPLPPIQTLHISRYRRHVFDDIAARYNSSKRLKRLNAKKTMHLVTHAVSFFRGQSDTEYGK